MGQVMVRRFEAVAVLAALLLLCGCETRSISDSGYNPHGGRGNPFYSGELTEFDLLGIDVSKPASEEEIAEQLTKRQRVGLHRGGAMMVIQSGALIPDDQMMKELDRYFSVVPFTGVPLVERERPSYYASSAPSPMVHDERITNYAKALRLAAAKSGADVILCYWGMIESAVEREPTKAISWIPLIGSVVPDENQLMRIRLKVAVIDVRTGQWSMFSPDAYVDSALSASLIRAQTDQKQVAALKEKVYKAAVDAFVAKYAS
jgi:hypothetical protein